VRKPGRRVDGGIAVEFGPAFVMMGNDVGHQVRWFCRLEAVVSEGPRELSRKCGVFVHHDREVRFTLRCALDDHASLPACAISAAHWLDFGLRHPAARPRRRWP
jgi:hypothetical protein